jgi:threonine aldolase
MSVTQSTEYGTTYAPDELGRLAEHARSRGLRVHVDGARLANAAVSLGCTLAEAATGADVVSLGGTKNGGMLSEAIVVLNPDAAQGVDFLRKTSMQLASKMRFISAQLLALFEGDLWQRNAAHANAMARRLAERVGTLEAVRITQPVQANAVFAVLPAGMTIRLQQEHRFYTWNEHTGEVRWMCSWDTTEKDVDAFADAIAAAQP